MLKYVRGQVADRKVRLFVCICCRRVWRLLPKAGRQAVEATEEFADGKIGRRELARFADAAYQAHQAPKVYNDDARRAAALAAWCATSASSHSHTTWSSSDYASLAVGFQGSCSKYREFQATEKEKQCGLLRHIVGNPFRPCPAPSPWPITVIQLADAFSNGQDCGFALHDALLDAGHSELADHFHQEQAHPKGCWVLDLLLEKA